MPSSWLRGAGTGDPGNVVTNSRIGIGMSAPTDPQAPLEVNGDAIISDWVGIGGNGNNDNRTCLSLGVSAPANGYCYIDAVAQGGTAWGNLILQDPHDFNDGKVGIGVTAPGAKLDVNGDIKIPTANRVSSTQKVFNVLDYGAVQYTSEPLPPNATDSAPKIQQALNDAHNAGGGVVYLPAGIYSIANAPLVVYENITLAGAGMEATILVDNLPPGTLMRGIIESDHGTWSPSGWSLKLHICIRDLSVHAGNQYSADHAGVFLRGVLESLVENVKVD